MFSFDEKKILFAKKLLISNPNRGVYNDIFNLFRDEIKRLIDFGLKYKSILSLLEKELDYSLNYKTFMSWINRSIKQKNQNSEGLKNNSQTEKKEIKKEVKQEPGQNATKKEDEDEKDDEPWWEKRLRESLEGMKKADLRI